MIFPETYEGFVKQMESLGCYRVERDDRLLDVFIRQTREKGVELWEKNNDNVVDIIRLRLPYNPKKIKTCSISRIKLEKALQSYEQLNIESLKQSEDFSNKQGVSY